MVPAKSDFFLAIHDLFSSKHWNRYYFDLIQKLLLFPILCISNSEWENTTKKGKDRLLCFMQIWVSNKNELYVKESNVKVLLKVYFPKVSRISWYVLFNWSRYYCVAKKREKNLFQIILVFKIGRYHFGLRLEIELKIEIWVIIILRKLELL